jgi:hypothetical protein
MGSEAHAEQVRRLEREGHVVRNNRVALPVLKEEGELDALLWAPVATRAVPSARQTPAKARRQLSTRSR